jgi:DNA-binding NarL/FixJ family response regulator
MSTLRIILADDHDVVRAGLRGVLDRLPNVEVVGEAENGRAAVDLVRTLSPNIILMDIAMPDLNGLEATRQIVAMDIGVKVLILSMHSSRQFVSEVLKAGASGYVLRSRVAPGGRRDKRRRARRRPSGSCARGLSRAAASAPRMTVRPIAQRLAR